MSSSVEQPTSYFNCYKPTKRKLDQRDQFYQGETSGGNVSYYDCDITTKYVCLAELDCASENAMDISSETSSPRAQYSSHGSLFPEGATPLGATGLLCTAENQHGFVLQVIDEPEEVSLYKCLYYIFMNFFFHYCFCRTTEQDTKVKVAEGQ